MQLDSQKHNKENLNQFLAHFSIAFTEIETKVTQVDEKSQANFEILEEIKEVKEIIPLIKQIHKWTFSIANLLNAELNYPAPKDQKEFFQDPEGDCNDWQMLSAYVGSNGNFWIYPWQSIWFFWNASKLTPNRDKTNDDLMPWN